MNIKFEGKYKSIENLNWEDIPKLAVITGENGTGKSQLLDIIRAGVRKRGEVVISPSNRFPVITGAFYRTEELFFLRDDWGLEDIGQVGLEGIQRKGGQIFQQFESRYSQLKSSQADK